MDLPVFLLIAFGGVMGTAHGCHAGDAYTQWLIPCVSAWCILSFTRPTVLRFGAPIVLIVGAFLLGEQYKDLVHKDVYVGYPTYNEMRSRSIALDKLESVKAILREAEGANQQTYAEGYVLSLDLIDLIRKDKRSLLEHRLAHTYSLWHSPISRLFGCTYVPMAIWYPGGTLGNVVDEMEYRPS